MDSEFYLARAVSVVILCVILSIIGNFSLLLQIYCRKIYLKLEKLICGKEKLFTKSENYQVLYSETM